MPTRVPMLADSPVSEARRCQGVVPAVQPEARFGPTPEGDQPNAEVVTLGVSVLGDETGGSERLEQAVSGAHREAGRRGEGRDAQILSGRLQDAEHTERPVDGLRAASPVATARTRLLHRVSLLHCGIPRCN